MSKLTGWTAKLAKKAGVITGQIENGTSDMICHELGLSRSDISLRMSLLHAHGRPAQPRQGLEAE